LETTPGSTEQSLVGTIVDGRFEILSLIGSGHTGSVYKAKHMLLNRPVALKVLGSHNSVDPASHERSSQRFQQEAKLIAALSHPNIVRVFDFGFTPDGQSFLVMDWLNGQPLSALLQSEKHLSLERSVSIAIQVCDALTLAHTNGIIHRDLKPSNIMLVTREDNPEQVQLVDFGIAKILSPEGYLHLTQTGEMFANPAYMSPEQCIGRELDCRSDIYSLGCVLYEMLTGVQPFSSDDGAILASSRLKELPPSFSSLPNPPAIPTTLEALVFKALAVRPENRFQTAQEMRSALAAHENKAAKTTGPSARAASQSKPPVRSILISLSAVILLVLGTLTGLAIFARQNPDAIPVLEFRYWLATMSTDLGDERRFNIGLLLFQKLRHANKTKQALNLFLSLPPLTPLYLDRDPIRIAQTYADAAFLLAEEKHTDEAIDLAKSTVAVVQKKIEKSSRDGTLSLPVIAELARQRVRLLQLWFGPRSKQALAAGFNLVDRLQQAGEDKEAQAAWKECQKSFRVERSWKSEFGTDLFKIGMGFFKRKQFSEARETLTQARKCFTNVNRQESLNQVTANLAVVYEIKGKTDTARELLTDLADDQKADLEQNSQDAAYAFFELGCFELRMHEQEKGLGHLRRSLSVYRALNVYQNSDVPGSAAELLARFYKSAGKKAEFDKLMADPFARAAMKEYVRLGRKNGMIDVNEVEKLLSDTEELARPRR
jgi:serine/threonine protein kinase